MKAARPGGGQGPGSEDFPVPSRVEHLAPGGCSQAQRDVRSPLTPHLLQAGRAAHQDQSFSFPNFTSRALGPSGRSILMLWAI